MTLLNYSPQSHIKALGKVGAKTHQQKPKENPQNIVKPIIIYILEEEAKMHI